MNLKIVIMILEGKLGYHKSYNVCSASQSVHNHVEFHRHERHAFKVLYIHTLHTQQTTD